MKIASFTHQGRTRLGVVIGDRVLDTAGNTNIPAAFSGDVLALLQAGAPALHTLQDWLAMFNTGAPASGSPSFALNDVTLQAPIARPPKYLAIALNYAEHIGETALPKPEFPMFFNKQSTCVTGPYSPIHMPRVSNKLDYEGELGVVIGKRCRHVPRDRAMQVIAGYLVVNDVTVRDWQAKSATFTLGKSFDTHGPIGPYLVTPEDVPDPQNLNFRTLVNGQERQSSNTRHMLFSIAEQIATLSTAFTLEPGDIIATGTCAGVGVKMTPRGYLKVGDVCRVEIEGIGYIENTVIEEPADTAGIF